ncbi:MAG: hypothetical protein HC904_01630 [Blastochloris sp.]|nr:hypothetical protein [Blastochloris sp.]
MRAVRGEGLEAELAQNVTLPDLQSFLRVEGTALQILRNELGDPEQTLSLQLAVGVKAEELEKKMTLYLLPRDKKQSRTDGEEGAVISRNFRWESPADISEDVLRDSEKIKFRVQPSEADFSQLHAVKLKLPPGRSIYLSVEKDLSGLGGFIMPKAYANVLPVPEYPRELRIMHEGSVLALGGDRTLSLQSRGVSRVECRLGRIHPDQINHLVSQTEGNFQNPYFRNSSFGEDNLSRSSYQSLSLEGQDAAQANYTALDFNQLLAGQDEARGLFFLEVSEQGNNLGSPERLAQPGPDYQVNQSRWEDQNRVIPQDRRFILITDLGIIVKGNADGTQEVFVQSIKSGQPVVGAEVAILGKNGTEVAKATTNGEGRASLPRVLDLKRERAPVAFVVKRGRIFPSCLMSGRIVA